MEKAIIKAIEGGYKVSGYLMIKTVPFKIDAQRFMLLDPQFWQTLGKAMGWKDNYYCSLCNSLAVNGCDETCAYFRGNEPQWKYEWHKLIYHLSEGKDIESFFNNLIK